MNKLSLFLLVLIIPLLLTAQVTVRDTTIIWHTFNYELNEDNTIKWSTDDEFDVVEKTYTGIVIENTYLKVTLLPELGGRILSMIYKPTGNEELYQNPVGSPYGIGEDWFYYKWLMVYGGIFPTLSEPEHGKAWLLPWESTIVKEVSDTISLQMSWRDTVQLGGIDLNKWRYGKTNLKCEFTVTLIKGKSSLEADFALYNDSNESLDYEFWTCLTLAPGSIPGNPQCTSGTEIIIHASKIKIPSWYPDIARMEDRIQDEYGIYTFNSLRYWANWANDGIAYPWDDTDKNYWGLINHDNKEGIIRIADNSITPGIKIWAWGYEQSQNIDPFKDPKEAHRPYVELWAGHSNEFFESAQIENNSVKQWKEIYVPTVGLSNITHANDKIIANLKLDDENIVNLSFVTTYPEYDFNVIIKISGENQQILISESISPDPVNGNQLTIELPTNQTWLEGDSLVCIIMDSDGETFLRASIPLDSVTTDVASKSIAFGKDFEIYQNYPNPFNPETIISYSLPKSGFVTMKVYDVLGKEVSVLVNGHKKAGKYEVIFNSSSNELAAGVYFYQLKTNGHTQTKRMVLLK